jgi:transposase-like protein
MGRAAGPAPAPRGGDHSALPQRIRSLLQRLRQTIAPPAKLPMALDRGRMSLSMICPRCRLPMKFVGASAEESLEDGEPFVRRRWRCDGCGATSGN